MIIRKHNLLKHIYCVNGSLISWKAIVQYLGVFINSTLNWANHLCITAAKATRRVNLLCHLIWGCSCLVKSLVYKSSIRPMLHKCGTPIPLKTSMHWSQFSAGLLAGLRVVDQILLLDFWPNLSAECVSLLQWPTLELFYVCLSSTIFSTNGTPHCVLMPFAILNPYKALSMLIDTLFCQYSIYLEY